MFISKQRPIVVPQWEHQQLAGTLALLWGNAAFERPAIPSASFLAGVGLHDRAYGPLDNLPIGGIPEADWLALTQAGFATAWADPAADLIVKLHLQRLTGYGTTPERQAAATAMAEAIEVYAARHGLDLPTFTRIDRITNLCDRIAFDFCFEAPASGTVNIFPRNDAATEVAVNYRIAGDTILVDPWPFSAAEAHGYLMGYQCAGYPTELEPVVLPYCVRPGEHAMATQFSKQSRSSAGNGSPSAPARCTASSSGCSRPGGLTVSAPYTLAERRPQAR
jgi:hypothetical protein